MGSFEWQRCKIGESAEGCNKKFLGVHSRFPLLGLELEAGLTPLRWEARRRAIRYWVKVYRLRGKVSKILVWAKGRNDREDGIRKVTQMLG